MKTVRFQLLPLAFLGLLKNMANRAREKSEKKGVCFSLENLHTWLLTRAGKKAEKKRKKKKASKDVNKSLSVFLPFFERMTLEPNALIAGSSVCLFCFVCLFVCLFVVVVVVVVGGGGGGVCVCV